MTRDSFDAGIPDVSDWSLGILRRAKVKILDAYLAKVVTEESAKTETQCSSLTWPKDDE